MPLPISAEQMGSVRSPNGRYWPLATQPAVLPRMAIAITLGTKPECDNRPSRCQMAGLTLARNASHSAADAAEVVLRGEHQCKQ